MPRPRPSQVPAHAVSSPLAAGASSFVWPPSPRRIWSTACKWNEYLGRREAYAATNFPLGVVTLYRPFFEVATDDTERAAILFHEAQHLLGAREDAALETVWREKERLGWTADKYGGTRVWKNTRE